MAGSQRRRIDGGSFEVQIAKGRPTSSHPVVMYVVRLPDSFDDKDVMRVCMTVEDAKWLSKRLRQMVHSVTGE